MQRCLAPASVLRTLWSVVPSGGSLPEDVWRQRRRFLLGLTWFHAILIPFVGAVLGYHWELSIDAVFRDGTMLHTLGEALIVAFFAVLAGRKKASRTFQATAIGFGMMSASAILVHLSGGYIEFHFHFFVMLTFLALFQDWIPYILAVAYVGIHHGVVGVLWPEEVFNHTAALEAPWTWAGIHAFFVLWASVGSVIAWRFNERASAHTKLILQSAGEGIFGLDLDRTVMFLNPAAATILGVDPAAVVGEPLHRIVRHTNKDGIPFPDGASPIEASLADGTRRGGTDDLFWPNGGSGFPVDYVITPIVDRGRLTGVVVTFKDVTERKRAENNILLLNEDLERRVLERTVALTELHADAERARGEAEETARRARLLAEASRVLASSLDYDRTLRDVVDLMVSGLADWCVVQLGRRDGRVRRIGPAYADPRLGALADAIGNLEPSLRVWEAETFTDAIRFGKPLLLAEVSEAQLAQAIRDSVYRRLVLELGPKSVMVVPLVARGRVLGAMIIVSLRPERRYGEADLALAQDVADRAALAVDNARLYRHAERSREDAEAANRAKDDFLAVLSHELRTPLTAMLGWARMLGQGRLDPPSTARAVEVIERNTQLQAQLIDDLLDVSRIIAGKLELDVQLIDLVTLVEAVVDSTRQVADAKQIELRTAFDPHRAVVEGDARRLQQVLWNLLTNSIKFTPKGGRVDVRLEPTDGHARIEVTDTGVGIAPEVLPHIFERFHQAATTGRSHGGLGLGLAIVRHLVERHKGTVTAESAGEGRGATFTVTLPLALAVPRPERLAPPVDFAPADASDEVPSLAGTRILLVEDESDTREMLRTLLANRGAEVTAVASGVEALEALASVTPDVLVTDLGMPGMDGYDLLAAIRASGAGSAYRLPAVALTAYAAVQDRSRALLAGFDLHLAKPVEPSDLLRTVAALATRRQP